MQLNYYIDGFSQHPPPPPPQKKSPQNKTGNSSLELLLLGYSGSNNQCFSQVITHYCHSIPKKTIISHDKWQTCSQWLDVNLIVLSLTSSVHSSLSFFTISKSEIQVTGACGSQGPYQRRNRLCDSVVFSASFPGVTSTRIEKAGLWISQYV